MDSFFILLIPIGFFLVFFVVQGGVNKRAKRRWICWLPAVALALLAAGVALMVELSVSLGPWRGLVTMAIPRVALLPGLLGAGIGAAVNFYLNETQRKKDGEANER